MEDFPFDKFEKAIDQLIERIDQLTSENAELKKELEKAQGNHRSGSDEIAILQKEKEELAKKMKEFQVDQKKEEKIKNHIDSILKKLEELQMTFQ